MGNTPNHGWPYPEGGDLPDGAAQMEALALAVDASMGLKMVRVSKSADQAGMASGASAGFAATMTDVPVGSLILCIIIAVQCTSAGPTEQYVGPTGMVGCTVTNPSHDVRVASTAANIYYTIPHITILTATEPTVSVTYRTTLSTGATWTCSIRSSITLVRL